MEHTENNNEGLSPVEVRKGAEIKGLAQLKELAETGKANAAVISLLAQTHGQIEEIDRRACNPNGTTVLAFKHLDDPPSVANVLNLIAFGPRDELSDHYDTLGKMLVA